MGVAADSDNMIGHSVASWSYSRSASTKLHAYSSNPGTMKQLENLSLLRRQVVQYLSIL
jgi:hypothetical protein